MSDNHEENTLHRYGARVVAGLTGLCAGIWFAQGGVNFCLDDAWIHLAYARSIQLGEGLSYNPHDWATGASSLLWAPLLSLLPLTEKPVFWVKTVGIILHALNAVLAAHVVQALLRFVSPASSTWRNPLIGMAAGILVALHPGLLQAATSGMEVGLTSCVLLGMVSLLLMRGPDRGQALVASIVAGLAVLCRPEAVMLCVPLGLLLAVRQRRWSRLGIAVGGAAGMGAWVLYCLTVSGYPWPNTRYVKAQSFGLQGLDYLLEQVLAFQPWVVGLGGVVLIGFALLGDAREGSASTPKNHVGWASALCVAWLATCVGIAVSRPLKVDVLFYMSRYFTIVAAFPMLLMGLGMARARPTVASVAWAAVLIASLWQLPGRRNLVHLQERNIARLHTEPAQYLAQTLPEDAVVVVEGAGASRFFTPRSMTIVDMLGLNFSAVAHAKGDLARVCALYAEAPNYLLTPTRYASAMRTVFQTRFMKAFAEPQYAQTVDIVPRHVLLLEITGYLPQLLARCSDP